jgi:CcmD family protein
MVYLFAAFAVVWLAFFAYNRHLVQRLSRLEQEAELLQNYLEERGHAGNG